MTKKTSLHVRRFGKPRFLAVVAVATLSAGLLAAAEGPLTQEETAQLKAQIAAQQLQIDQLRRTLETQQNLLNAASPNPRAPLSAVTPDAPPARQPEPPQPRLFFQIGEARFTPFGFVDVTQVIRSTNAGGGIGTTFNSIPFNNTAAGQLSESRFSLQNSRLGLRVDSKYRGADILAYLETDFLGNVPGNLTVTSNSAANRLRLFWVQLKRNKWEFLGGQSWSMLTPGRKGISPLPSDLFYSQVVDTNYQNGLTWARQPGVRLVYHPSKSFAWGLAAESADQYVGGAVTFPAALSAAGLPAQFNNGTAGTATPNLHPDLISKVAYDADLNGKAMHLELGAVLRTFRSFNPLTSTHFAKVGGGGEAGLNLEVARGFRVIANAYLSSGGGRYILGSGPDLIAKPNGDISLVRAASTVDGFEYSFTPKGNETGKETLFYAYYGGAYFRKNSGIDAGGKAPAYFGYGYPDSPLAANRAIDEYTFGVHQTFWKSANYGDLRLMTQYSYLLRDPWSVPSSNRQRNAYTNMLFLNLRYDLP